MRILVITSEPRWVNAVRATFTGEHDVMTGDPRQPVTWRTLLGAVDVGLVAEAEIGPFTIDALKQLAPGARAPLFVVADVVRPDWEEAALNAGAWQVFKTPMRPAVMHLAISRARSGWPIFGPRAGAPVPAAGASAAAPMREPRELALLREFSRVLAHPTRDASFLSAYLGLIREVLGASRLILYLSDSGAAQAFRIAAAIGVDARQFENFRLYREHGLGRLTASRIGVIARDRLSPDDADQNAARREMDLFGSEFAVPIAAADGWAGMLLLGPRITGGAFSDQELTLLYHLLEELGSAVTRHVSDPTSAQDGPLFPAVLDALPVGCALIDASLRILNANDAFRSQLGSESANPMGIERLPSAWAEAIQGSIAKRTPELRLELDHELSGVLRHMRLTLQPLETKAGQDAVWLMVTEDITDETRLRAEVHDRSMHNVLQRAGEQLSNEFRNALTPIEILVQLSGESASGRRDIDRLRTPVSLAIHRLRRRIDNLGYLTKSSIVPELTTVSAVFRSARERLDHWVEPKHLKTLVWSGEFSKVAFTADNAAVGLALAELVVNAIEAAGGRQVTITAEDLPDAVNFKVRNPGEWSPPAESSGFGHRPFVTAKSTGVGLGVEVATRVAEYHGGRLVLGPVSPDTVEAILRIPRNLPVVPANFETPVAKSW